MARQDLNGPPKRAAPISASAFAFSFSTPKNKKPKVNHTNTITPLSSIPNPTQTPSNVKKEWSTPRPPTFTARQVSHTSIKALNVEQDEHQLLNGIPKPFETPLRGASTYKPLTAFTTPLTHQPKLGDPGPSSSSKVLRPLHERIGDVTPVKGKEKESEFESKPRFALHETLLSGKTAGDILIKKKLTLKDEDEGLGVSPRGKRIAKWSGNGPPPPSVNLANLLSSSNASLHLFYTSMQHLLYPSQRGNTSLVRSRQTTSDNTNLTPLQHIENSASIRLKIVDPVQGPTHHSTMFWCEPIKWHNGSIPTRHIPVIFQPLPHECPKLGVDPRLLAMKMKDEAGKQWQAGVWAWAEVDLPLGVEKFRKGGDDQEGNDKEGEEDETMKPLSALIVSRYLIVEQPVV
ncbi:uncharacterized protein L199_001031 [Kwoniella botswanensis]|uniref:uncharacterized protein n=1 Tax=Kwoniella botswanensis TaxID=1268659 RepID=UPI00315C8687